MLVQRGKSLTVKDPEFWKPYHGIFMSKEYYGAVVRHDSKIKDSVVNDGQWHPITVNKDGLVLDGHDRFIQCRANGIVPKTDTKSFATKEHELLFVYKSNLLRRQLFPFEEIMLAKKIALLEDALDKKHGVKSGKKSQSQTVSHDTKKGIVKNDKSQRLREKIQDLTNIGEKTIAKALVIEKHAKADQIAKLNKNEKKINTVYNIIKTEQNFQQRKNIPIPPGKWNFIVWDPSWPYRRLSTGGTQSGGQAHHYPSETIEDMCRKNIVEHAMEDAILAVWTTFPFLHETFRLITAAGFRYRESGYVWIKSEKEPIPDQIFKPGILGMGTDFRVQAEIILFGERGNVPAFGIQEPNIYCTKAERKNNESVHSKKPPYFRSMFDRIAEKIFPVPAKLELNAVPKNGEIHESGVWKEKDWTCVGNGVYVN